MLDSENAESGFALVAVLSFLTLFALFLAPFATASRIRALTVSNHFETARFDLAAEAINAMLAHELAVQPGLKARLLETSRLQPLSCKIGSASLSLQIVDQASLIDLNKGTAESIAAALVGLGLNASNADEAANAMVSFRSVQPAAGVISDQVAPKSGMKHGPFEHLAELHEFGPLKDIPMNRLSRVFTLFNPNGTLLDRSLAPSLEGHLSPNLITSSSETYLSSEILSIETSFGIGAARGFDNAVVLIDNSNKTVSRLASKHTMKGETYADAAAISCSSIMGPSIPLYVQQSLDP